MILITKAARIASLTARLRAYVAASPSRAFRYGPMIEKLEALDSISPADVTEIMGNDYLVETTCIFCRQDSEVVVRLGEVEMVDIDICLGCLETARGLVP